MSDADYNKMKRSQEELLQKQHRIADRKIREDYKADREAQSRKQAERERLKQEQMRRVMSNPVVQKAAPFVALFGAIGAIWYVATSAGKCPNCRSPLDPQIRPGTFNQKNYYWHCRSCRQATPYSPYDEHENKFRRDGTFGIAGEVRNTSIEDEQADSVIGYTFKQGFSLTGASAAKASGLTNQQKSRLKHAIELLQQGVKLDNANDLSSEAKYQEALHVTEEVLGPDDICVAQILNSLGCLALSKKKNYAEARPYFERCISIAERQPDPDELLVLGLNNLAFNYQCQHQMSEAEACYNRALSLAEKQLAPTDEVTQTLKKNIDRLITEKRSGATSQRAEPKPSSPSATGGTTIAATYHQQNDPAASAKKDSVSLTGSQQPAFDQPSGHSSIEAKGAELDALIARVGHEDPSVADAMLEFADMLESDGLRPAAESYRKAAAYIKKRTAVRTSSSPTANRRENPNHVIVMDELLHPPLLNNASEASKSLVVTGMTALRRNNDPQKALSQFESALEQTPNLASAWLGKAYCEAALTDSVAKRLALIQESFEKASKLINDDALLYRHYAAAVHIGQSIDTEVRKTHQQRQAEPPSHSSTGGTTNGSPAIVRSYIAQWKLIVLSPRQYFKSMPVQGGFREAVTFVVLIAAINGLVWLLTNLSNPLSAVIGALSLVAASFLFAGVTTGLCKWLGGSGNFEASYRACSFAMAPYVVLWVPVVNLFALLYSLLLLKLALERAHGLTSKRCLTVVTLDVFVMGIVAVSITLVRVAHLVNGEQTQSAVPAASNAPQPTPSNVLPNAPLPTVSSAAPTSPPPSDVSPASPSTDQPAQQPSESPPAPTAETTSTTQTEGGNTAASVSQANATPDAQVQIERMINAAKVGNNATLDDAQSAIEAPLKPAPGDAIEADRLNKLGLAALKSKSYGEAVSAFSRASTADPSDPKLLSNLGFAEMHTGDLASAEMHLYDSLAIAPSRSVAWGNLGQVLAKRGDQEAAVASFLIGYRVSNGDTLGFLKSLKDDDDSAIQNAGRIALSRIQPPSDSSIPAPATATTPRYETTEPKSVVRHRNEGGNIDTSRL